jgi:hypothetical protein
MSEHIDDDQEGGGSRAGFSFREGEED